MASSVAMQAAPMLTVAMPVFNAGKYLKQAVLSIVLQSFRDWELLIIDDGSTDCAIDELVSIVDARIIIVRDGVNKGLAARLNEAIDMARGRYFARMDQDDVSYPDRFLKQINLLKGDSTLDVVSVRAIRISDADEMTGLTPCFVTHDQICARPWQGFCFPHPTWLGKLEWFKEFRYAQPGPYFCEDQELLLRSYSLSRFGAVDEILFAYRVRETSNLKRVLKTRWTFLLIQLKYFSGKGQLHYSLLACLVYAGLVARDIWWDIKKVPAFPSPHGQLPDQSELHRWQKINAQLVKFASSTS